MRRLMKSHTPKSEVAEVEASKAHGPRRFVSRRGCSQLHLDSGSQRLNAHRFYERENMTFASHLYVSQL